MNVEKKKHVEGILGVSNAMCCVCAKLMSTYKIGESNTA